MTGQTSEGEKDPFDNGRGYLVNLAALLLVSTLMGGNLLALGMSLPPVISNAGRTFEASTSGALDLPFFPDAATRCLLHAPSVTDEGVPFNITLTFSGGQRPHPTQYLVISSILGELRFRLWDSWTQNGSWMGWTRVPGLEGGVNWTVGALSGRENGTLRNLSAHTSIEVIKGKTSFLLPITDYDLSSSSAIRFREVRREDLGGIHPSYILKEVGGRSMTLAPDDLSYVPTRRWSEFDIERRLTNPPSDPRTWVKTQRGFLLGREVGPTLDSNTTVISFRTLLDHRDALYELEKGVTVNDGSGSITLMAGTYYKASIAAKLAYEDNGWYPLPELALWSGGTIYPLAPTPQRSVWKGVMFVPQGYEGDVKSRISVGPGPDRMGGPDLLRLNVTLSDNPAPDITISPDPFSLDGWNGRGPLKVSFKGEWELVNWRVFREMPQVVIDGSDLGPVSVTDGYEYTYLLDVTSNATLEEGEILIGATTRFAPAETVLLLVRIEGPLLPIWFFMLFIAIALSCSYLMGKGLRPLVEGGPSGRKAMLLSMLRDRDNDLIATSRTYIGALFFSLAVVVLFNMMEQPTPAPDILSKGVPVWVRMVALAHASVWEEVVTRVLMIGMPLALWHLGKGGKGNALRELLGGQGRISVPAAILILFSASLFGLAHLGWGLWKVVPTFVMGLLFGFLYVKIGLHASIALHFLFDYSSFLAEIVEGRQGPYIWTLLFLFSLFAGGLMLADLLTRAVTWSKAILPVKKRPLGDRWELFLVLHAAAALAFGGLMVVSKELWVIGLIMLSVPLIDGAAFLLDRALGGPVPRMLVYFSSLVTLPAAPLGLAWVIGPDS